MCVGHKLLRASMQLHYSAYMVVAPLELALIPTIRACCAGEWLFDRLSAFCLHELEHPSQSHTNYPGCFCLQMNHAIVSVCRPQTGRHVFE